MKFFNYVIIAQTALILILFVWLVLYPKKEKEVNYDVIKEQNKEVIAELKNQLKEIQQQNIILISKIDTLKTKIPEQKQKLKVINEKINNIKNNFQTYNYTDSSDQYLISRLSK